MPRFTRLRHKKLIKNTTTKNDEHNNLKRKQSRSESLMSVRWFVEQMSSTITQEPPRRSRTQLQQRRSNRRCVPLDTIRSFVRAALTTVTLRPCRPQHLRRSCFMVFRQLRTASPLHAAVRRITDVRRSQNTSAIRYTGCRCLAAWASRLRWSCLTNYDT